MSEFVRICSQSELPAVGQVAEFTVSGRAICVANATGAVAVLDGTCPHEGGPLGEGSIENGRLVCPWHAYSFDVKTGESEHDPDVKAEVLESKIENGELKARI
ncbi:MAG TPA: Rieske (2Fe-2S) protein [Terracidiphilus sp.]|nr:Rieske (2Fe-2S) protein [Terracidiphilus sp.]